MAHVEQSFRVSKSDLAARPIYHYKRESIDAHLTIACATLAVSRWIEHRTGWSIKKFVKTTRRYRTIETQAAGQPLTAADYYLPILPTSSARSVHLIVRTKLSQVR